MIGVIYARYSSDNQREESIEGQLRECRQYADRNGITLLDPYIDRAYSAKTDIKLCKRIIKTALVKNTQFYSCIVHIRIFYFHAFLVFFVLRKHVCFHPIVPIASLDDFFSIISYRRPSLMVVTPAI